MQRCVPSKDILFSPPFNRRKIESMLTLGVQPVGSELFGFRSMSAMVNTGNIKGEPHDAKKNPSTWFPICLLIRSVVELESDMLCMLALANGTKQEAVIKRESVRKSPTLFICTDSRNEARTHRKFSRLKMLVEKLAHWMSNVLTPSVSSKRSMLELPVEANTA